MSKKSTVHKVGRDARTGQFADKRKGTAVVERVTKESARSIERNAKKYSSVLERLAKK